MLLCEFSTQGYYRRGDANFMLGKFKEALKDLKTVRAVGHSTVQAQCSTLQGGAGGSAAQHGAVQGRMGLGGTAHDRTGEWTAGT